MRLDALHQHQHQLQPHLSLTHTPHPTAKQCLLHNPASSPPSPSNSNAKSSSPPSRSQSRPPLLITLSNNPTQKENIPTSHPLLTTLSHLHHPALLSPKSSLISLKTIGSAILTDVGVRIEIDILFLPILRTLDINHFLSVEGNRRLNRFALRAPDLEELPLFFEDPPSIAAQLIFNLPNLKTVYTVEGERVGDDIPPVTWAGAREGVLEDVPEHVRVGVPGTRHSLRGGDVWDSMEMAIAELNWRLVVNRERERRGKKWEGEGRVPRVVCKRVRWVGDCDDEEEGLDDIVAWNV